MCPRQQFRYQPHTLSMAFRKQMY